MAKQISKHTVKPHIYAEIGSQSRLANKAVDMCLRPQTIGGFSRQMEFCPRDKWRSGPDVIIANQPLPTFTTVVAQIVARKRLVVFSIVFLKSALTLKNSSTSAWLIYAINKQCLRPRRPSNQLWLRPASPTTTPAVLLCLWHDVMVFGAPPFAYEKCLGFLLEGWRVPFSLLRP